MTNTSLTVANTTTTMKKARKGMEKTKSLLSNTSEWAVLHVQEFFEIGKDSASALCVGNDFFVSSTVLEPIAASPPM